MTNKERAAVYRELAKQCDGDAYRYGSRFNGFTCNDVGAAFDAGERSRYSRYVLCSKALELWRLPPNELQSVRTLLLCFAAAMCETGDL